MDDHVRREFVQRATEFLEANATCRVDEDRGVRVGRGRRPRPPDGRRRATPRTASPPPRPGGPRCSTPASAGSAARPSTAAAAATPSSTTCTASSKPSSTCPTRARGAWRGRWSAPAVLAHGSEDLKQRYLRRIYRGELLCSQLLSEPEGGSDLAGLRTRAVRDGDEWIVNGQKVWSSYAHKADIGQLMARTDPDVPKHQGLTMFLLPMDTAGVEVRPLRQMNGDAEFNEVFLTDVRVPDANRVGEAGSGWRAVLTTLMSERAAVGSGKSSIARSGGHADRAGPPPRPHRRPDRAPAAGRVLTHVDLLRWLTMRAESAVAAGKERGPKARS